MHFAYLLKIHWQPKHAIHAWPACNFAFLTIAFFTKAFNVSFFPSAAPNASLSTQCFLEHPVLSWAPSASFLLPLNHSWRPYMAQKEHG